MTIFYAVSIASLYPDCEEAVLVDGGGVATNRRADGTAGVQVEYQEAAEVLFDPDNDPRIEYEDS